MFESQCASVLEVLRANISLARIPVIRGKDDPNKAYKTLVERFSQDNIIKVTSIIEKVETIKYNGVETISSFLKRINNLHTQIWEATAQDPKLQISDKLLEVFLIFIFPGDGFTTIQDQLFGDSKSPSTSKVVSQIQTKTNPLKTVAESATAMDVLAISSSSAPTFQLSQ